MNATALLKSTVPVILGVMIAGYILNALRENSVAAQAIAGFDA